MKKLKSHYKLSKAKQKALSEMTNIKSPFTDLAKLASLKDGKWHMISCFMWAKGKKKTHEILIDEVSVWKDLSNEKIINLVKLLSK